MIAIRLARNEAGKKTSSQINKRLFMHRNKRQASTRARKERFGDNREDVIENYRQSQVGDGRGGNGARMDLKRNVE